METALMTPEHPTTSLACFVLLEQVTVGHPGTCALLTGTVRDALSSPVFPAMTKDPAGLGRRFPLPVGKLPKALNPPCAVPCHATPLRLQRDLGG